MKAVVKDILPDIPITLSMVVGDIAIRFGELERVIITAMARVECTDQGKSDDTDYYLSLLGKFKKIKTLGSLIKKAQKKFQDREFEWIDFEALNKLRDQRNAIHDALVQGPDGTFAWQSSGNRRHRPIDYCESALLREATERPIVQINSGSLEYKRAASD